MKNRAMDDDKSRQNSRIYAIGVALAFTGKKSWF